MASNYGEYDGYAKAQSEHAAQSEPYKIQHSCAGLAGPEFVRCRFEVEKSTAETQHNEYDLKAQRDVALWTFWMTMASGLGLLMTGAGLYFLAANLKEMQEGRRLTQGALDLAKRDRRCWLSIKIQHGRAVKRDDGTYTGFKVRYDVEHFGDTPAFDLKQHVFHFYADDVFSVTDAATIYGQRAVQEAPKWPPSITPVFSETTQRGHFSAASLGKPETPESGGFDKSNHAVVAVTYKVVGDTETHYVCGVYCIEREAGSGKTPSRFIRMSYAAN